jgi:hypothetical protein
LVLPVRYLVLPVQGFLIAGVAHIFSQTQRSTTSQKIRTMALAFAAVFVLASANALSVEESCAGVAETACPSWNELYVAIYLYIIL